MTGVQTCALPISSALPAPMAFTPWRRRYRCFSCRAGYMQKIRHTDGKTDDVAASSLELLRLFGNDHDRAGFGAADTLGELGHGFLEWGTETANSRILACGGASSGARVAGRKTPIAPLSSAGIMSRGLWSLLRGRHDCLSASPSARQTASLLSPTVLWPANRQER